jgi:hypothetical protein
MYEENIERIKEYVLILNPDLEEKEDLLDFLCASVVDRFVLYTNRMQLEEEERVPEEVERILANTIVGVARTVSEGYAQSVQSASDRGQSVSFSNQLANYLSSDDESKIFLGSLDLLNKFRLANVVGAT